MLQRHPCAAAAEPVEQDAEEEEVDLTRQLDMGHDKNKGHTEHRQQEADEPDKQYKGRGQPLLSLDEYLDNPPSCRLWPEARQECPQCRKRGRLYCAECLVFVGAPDGVDVPTGLQLPLEVDILVTAEERRRSSGVQIAVVAPQSVRMVPFEEAEGNLPSYDPECDLVVFPSEGSVCWSDLPPEDLAAARRIILIDSRWANTGTVVRHPQLKGLRHVRVRNPPTRSRFWRWHAEGEGCICTAEATYLVLKEFEEASGVRTVGGRLEDILFLFALVSSRIQSAYETDPAKVGKALPASEEAKRRRRLRAVRLDRLVKAKYKGLDAYRDQLGEEAAVEEFYRRRRGASIYGGADTNEGPSDNRPAEVSTG
eukprot:jgi/Undpi1/3447/HiC_scaffold_16.g06819.m1